MAGIQFHKHRIVPGHMGGTYESRNVIRVNVAMHAFLHKCLWEEHGRWQDRIAWQVLAGMIPKEEARRRAVSEMGKERWANDPVYRAKMIHAQSNPTPALSKKKSADSKRLWKDEAFRSKFNTGQAKRWSDPAQRSAASERGKNQKHALGHKHTPEAISKISAASRAQWVSFSEEKKQRILAKRWKTRRAKVH